MKKIIIGLITLAMTSCILAGCGVDSQSKIDEKYPVEAIYKTKITKLSGVNFYVPDDYLAQGDVSEDTYSYSLTIPNGGNIIRVQSTDIGIDTNDHEKLSYIFTKIIGIKVTINRELADNTWQCSIESESDTNALSGYIRFAHGYVILATGTADTAKSIVNSLVANETYNTKNNVVATAIINDAQLSAKMDGVSVGDTVSIDRIQSDYKSMEANYNAMKNDLSYINGESIQQINNTVYMNFQRISSGGQDANQAYLQSMGAYSNAVDQYNLQISNGIDLNSKKQAIMEALKIDLSPEWEQLVVENQNKSSAVRSIIINYDNETDKVRSIIVNAEDAINDIKNNSIDSVDSLEARSQTITDITDSVSEIFESETKE